MGDINILAYDYCEAKYHDYHNYHDYCLNYICIENRLQTCKTVSKHSKTYHGKCQLSRYYTIIASHDYCY